MTNGGNIDSTVRFLDAKELEEERRLQREEDTPIVKRECLCSNHHEPVDGYVYTSPACLIHGQITRHVPRAMNITSDRVRERQRHATHGAGKGE